jgi:hypothetical protein
MTLTVAARGQVLSGTTTSTAVRLAAANMDLLDCLPTRRCQDVLEPLHQVLGLQVILVVGLVRGRTFECE